MSAEAWKMCVCTSHPDCHIAVQFGPRSQRISVPTLTERRQVDKRQAGEQRGIIYVHSLMFLIKINSHQMTR